MDIIIIILLKSRNDKAIQLVQEGYSPFAAQVANNRFEYYYHQTPSIGELYGVNIATLGSFQSCHHEACASPSTTSFMNQVHGSSQTQNIEIDEECIEKKLITSSSTEEVVKDSGNASDELNGQDVNSITCITPIELDETQEESLEEDENGMAEISTDAVTTTILGAEEDEKPEKSHIDVNISETMMDPEMELVTQNNSDCTSTEMIAESQNEYMSEDETQSMDSHDETLEDGQSSAPKLLDDGFSKIHYREIPSTFNV